MELKKSDVKTLKSTKGAARDLTAKFKQAKLKSMQPK
jgi:hypothetical protein